MQMLVFAPVQGTVLWDRSRYFLGLSGVAAGRKGRSERWLRRRFRRARWQPRLRARPMCGPPDNNVQMEIRPAAITDAVRICEVVRASITDLCDADHAGEPEFLARWLSNKTPDDVVRWLSNPCNATLGVVDEGCIVAAGCVNAAGEVILN